MRFTPATLVLAFATLLVAYVGWIAWEDAWARWSVARKLAASAALSVGLWGFALRILQNAAPARRTPNPISLGVAVVIVVGLQWFVELRQGDRVRPGRAYGTMSERLTADGQSAGDPPSGSTPAALTAED